MLCYFNLLLGDILLYVLKRLLLKAYITYKADFFTIHKIHYVILK